ncbi:NADH:flavin oxidoreductase [Streptomyces sp. NPDC004610]|uniref:NADH:flavin oxidoreductase n=1 Tax=unclassified Streptomyces TaxID=2593676 RepID=UPI0033B6B71C
MTGTGLWTPLTIRGRRLKNRLVFPPFVNGFADGHRVSPTTVDWYRRLARGGVGTIITEALFVHPSSEPQPNMITGYHPDNRDRWARLAGTVEDADCRLIGQLVHAGRSRMLTGSRYQGVAPSAVADPYSGHVPRALTGAEIAELVDTYARTAATLAAAGFSGVEIHAAHGHLLSLFLSPRWNRRDDAYGGDPERRVRVIADIVTAVRASCPAGFLVSLALTAEEGPDGGPTADEAAAMFRRLTVTAPVDLVTYRAGTIGPTLADHIPDLTYPPAPMLDLQRRMRAANPDTPSLAVGRITDGAAAAQVLDSGAADLVALGRPLVVDPDLPRRLLACDLPERRCAYCNICWTEVQSGNPGRCPVAPAWGRPPEEERPEEERPEEEREDREEPEVREEQRVTEGRTATTPRGTPPHPPRRRPRNPRVTVVGGGVAGLTAAAVFAERGHQVTHFAGATPGGRLARQSLLPALRELAALVDAPRLRGRAADVRHLARRAEPTSLLATAPDLVVLATGATGPVPAYVRSAPTGPAEISALHAWDAERLRTLRRSPAPGGTAVIVADDDDPAAYALACVLAPLHHRTVVLTTAPEPLPHLSWIYRRGLERMLRRAGVHHRTGRVPVALRPGELEITTGAATETLADVTRLVWSSPRVPGTPLTGPLQDAGVPYLLLGDAAHPTTLPDILRDLPAALRAAHLVPTS